jgi:hypothetical protein
VWDHPESESLDGIFAHQVNRPPRPGVLAILEGFLVNATNDAKPKKECLNVSREVVGGSSVEGDEIGGVGDEAVARPESSQEKL